MRWVGGGKSKDLDYARVARLLGPHLASAHLFGNAAAPEEARISYKQVETALRSKGVPVETGRFGAYMKVDLVNDGPVTILVDSRRIERFAPGPQV